eukprot:XP_001700934.1 predicted protein [Chlamydomonas reinhardtii]
MAPAAESGGEDLAQLLQLCKELDTQPPPLRDSHAHAFFSGFPLERLFRALASAGDKDAVALVSDVLARLLATDLGQTLLPGSAPYLAAAADAPLPALRRLAAEQYGNLLISRTAARTTRQQGTAAVGGDGDDELASASLGQLVHILTDDPDTTRDRGGTVRLRVLELALELAAAGGDAGSGSRLANGVSNSSSGAHGGTASASGSSSSSADERLQLLRGSGLLQPLLRTLSDGGADPLACLASLQLLEELMAASDPDSDPATAGSSRAGQGVAVALAGLALPQLLQLLSDPMLSDAAMPLVAGISRAGAQLVLADVAVARALCSRALGRSPHPEYEETLRRCVYEACGGPSAAAGPSPAAAPLKRPGEVVLALLAQPFVELRLAAYRCVAALALRSWFAVELLTSPDLAARLMDAGSESGAAACNWRHAAVAALWATVSAAARGEVAGAGEEAFAATLAAPTTVDRARVMLRLSC